jgi:hypothetical protein
VYDYVRVEKFKERLLSTPPPGRPALIIASLDWLSVNRTDALASLISEMTSGAIEGFSRDSLSELLRKVHPSVLARAFDKLPKPRGFASSYLLSMLSVKESLPYVAAVRDRVVNPNEFLYTSGIVNTAIVLAGGLGKDPQDSVVRRFGDETLYLLGAAVYPEHVLRDMLRVIHHPAPSPVYDETIARWCLKNKNMTPRTRSYVISLLSSPVLANLCLDGTCNLSDVISWSTPKKDSLFDAQILTAMSTYESPGMVVLLHRLSRLVPKLPAYMQAMATPDLKGLLTALYPDLSQDSIHWASVLAPKWHLGLDSLISASQKLSARSRSF